jgi:hypothetical protein
LVLVQESHNSLAVPKKKAGKILKVIINYFSLLFSKNVLDFGFIFRFLVRVEYLDRYLRKSSDLGLEQLTIHQQSCLEGKRSIEFQSFEP